MHEQEDLGLGAILLQSIDAVAIIVEILEGFSCLNIKDVDQYRDVLKYRRPLGGEVAVHERVLTTAIPEVEDQVPEEADMVLFYVDGCTKPRGEGCGVI